MINRTTACPVAALTPETLAHLLLGHGISARPEKDGVQLPGSGRWINLWLGQLNYNSRATAPNLSSRRYSALQTQFLYASSRDAQLDRSPVHIHGCPNGLQWWRSASFASVARDPAPLVRAIEAVERHRILFELARDLVTRSCSPAAAVTLAFQQPRLISCQAGILAPWR